MDTKIVTDKIEWGQGIGWRAAANRNTLLELPIYTYLKYRWNCGLISTSIMSSVYSAILFMEESKIFLCREPLTNTYYSSPQYVSTYIVSQLAKLVGSLGKMSTQIFRKLFATKFSLAGSVSEFLRTFTKSWNRHFVSPNYWLIAIAIFNHTLQESQMLNLLLSSNIKDFTGLDETVGALQSPMISQTWRTQRERID